MGASGRSRILAVDGAFNGLLGLALLFFRYIAGRLGIPASESSFYPMILGAVLLGVGIALFLESTRGPNGLVGLGLGGAIAINLSGGVVLTGWLVTGSLNLPARGLIILSVLGAGLVGISTVELFVHKYSRPS
jgi:hypothetical protein